MVQAGSLLATANLAGPRDHIVVRSRGWTASPETAADHHWEAGPMLAIKPPMYEYRPLPDLLQNVGTMLSYAGGRSPTRVRVSRRAMLAAMGCPVANSSQYHTPLGLFSRKTNSPSGVRTKSMAPNSSP